MADNEETQGLFTQLWNRINKILVPRNAIVDDTDKNNVKVTLKNAKGNTSQTRESLVSFTVPIPESAPPHILSIDENTPTESEIITNDTLIYINTEDDDKTDIYYKKDDNFQTVTAVDVAAAPIHNIELGISTSAIGITPVTDNTLLYIQDIQNSNDTNIYVKNELRNDIKLFTWTHQYNDSLVDTYSNLTNSEYYLYEDYVINILNNRASLTDTVVYQGSAENSSAELQLSSDTRGEFIFFSQEQQDIIDESTDNIFALGSFIDSTDDLYDVVSDKDFVYFPQCYKGSEKSPYWSSNLIVVWDLIVNSEGHFVGIAWILSNWPETPSWYSSAKKTIGFISLYDGFKKLSYTDVNAASSTIMEYGEQFNYYFTKNETVTSASRTNNTQYICRLSDGRYQNDIAHCDQGKLIIDVPGTYMVFASAAVSWNETKNSNCCFRLLQGTTSSPVTESSGIIPYIASQNKGSFNAAGYNSGGWITGTIFAALTLEEGDQLVLAVKFSPATTATIQHNNTRIILHRLLGNLDPSTVTPPNPDE